MNNDFILEREIAAMHYDFDFDTNSVYIAIDSQHRLVVVHDCLGVQSYSKLYRAIAILDSEETYQLAKRLKVSVSKLTDYISDYYDLQEYFSARIIDEAFQDVLELLLDFGAHYRVELWISDVEEKHWKQIR